MPAAHDAQRNQDPTQRRATPRAAPLPDRKATSHRGLRLVDEAVARRGVLCGTMEAPSAGEDAGRNHSGVAVTQRAGSWPHEKQKKARAPCGASPTQRHHGGVRNADQPRGEEGTASMQTGAGKSRTAEALSGPILAKSQLAIMPAIRDKEPRSVTTSWANTQKAS
jgi:hypothetical protein